MEELKQTKPVFEADMVIVYQKYQDKSRLCVFISDSDTKPLLLKVNEEKWMAIESFFANNDFLPLTLGESSERIFQLRKSCRIVRELQYERRG